MSFPIDTCALSELIEPKPAPRVFGWFDAAAPEAPFVGALALGEIRKVKWRRAGHDPRASPEGMR